MSARRTAVLVRTLVVGAVLVGTAGFVSAHKVVTLSVDGEERQVSTYASTVGDLLAGQGMVVGQHDTVVPAASAEISDQARVEVRRGRMVTLSVDGVARQVWTTAATVDELTRSLGARYAAATLTVSRAQRIPLAGLSLGLRLQKSVTISHDGTTTSLLTSATTVGGVLLEAGIGLDADDLASPDLLAAPVDGLVVAVVRVTSDTTVVRTPIPFVTTRTADGSLAKGLTKVTRAGRAGTRATTYLVTLHDGTVVESRRTAVSTVRPPVTRVVVYGTKAAPTVRAPAASVKAPTGVDALNWIALARCESSGNPRSVGGNGRYFGLYQFTIGTWQGVGGTGNPIDSSAAEQTYRAKLLYKDRGAQPWPVCGRMLFT